MKGLSVAPNERGLIRVFALSLGPQDAKNLREDDARKKALLGAQSLDSDFTEVFPVSDLEGLGLVQYLIQGNGVAPETLEADRAKLAALDGWVLLVFSHAFGGVEQRLAPAPELTLIGSYPEEGTDWGPVPIESASAKPFSGPTAAGPQSGTPRAPRWLTYGLLLAALLLFGLYALRHV